MAGRIRVGTSGWSYDGWIGNFYPEGIRHSDLLETYVQSFNTVEINNTFYALPTRTSTARWRETAGKGFTFAVKGSRYLTHRKKLKEPQEGLSRFFHAIEPLAESTGPILFQLPPRWRANRERLEAFLKLLPADYRYTFEFRDQSWLNEEIYGLLEQYNISLCFYQFKGFISPELHTADFVYVRLHGPDGAYQGSYSDDALEQYADKFTGWAREGRDVYCYFDNDQKSYAPFNAMSLLDKLDIRSSALQLRRGRA